MHARLNGHRYVFLLVSHNTCFTDTQLETPIIACITYVIWGGVAPEGPDMLAMGSQESNLRVQLTGSGLDSDTRVDILAGTPDAPWPGSISQACILCLI